MSDNDGSYCWRPTPGNSKPPGNPFKQSEAKKSTPSAQASRNDEHKRRPIPNAEQTARMRAAQKASAVPPPEEVLAVVDGFKRSYIANKSMKAPTDNYIEPAKSGKTLTHLERIAATNTADERWFSRNERVLRQIRSGR